MKLSTPNNILQRGVDAGVFTHAAYAVAVGGEVVATETFGAATPSTIFDLASLTKPMSTATLLLQCVERGELHLGQTVETFFTNLHGPLTDLADVDLFDLVTHTAGLPPVPEWPSAPDGLSRTDLMRHVLKTPRGQLPGVGYAYSDTGYIILGEIIALATGQPLPILFQTRIAEPAGLSTTGFIPSADWHDCLAPTSKTAAIGMVHDPRARDMGGVAGHAGLFGTAADVLTYLEIIRKGGGPLLSRASAARMSTSQIETSVGAQSIGWFCAGNDFLPKGDLFSDRSFGHSGFTGAVALIDPEYDVSLVLLTNRVINDADDNRRFLMTRRQWTNALAAAVTSG
jgi:CubicO group peptidase (beta-lactamase class C family)